MVDERIRVLNAIKNPTLPSIKELLDLYTENPTPASIVFYDQLQKLYFCLMLSENHADAIQFVKLNMQNLLEDRELKNITCCILNSFNENATGQSPQTNIRMIADTIYKNIIDLYVNHFGIPLVHPVLHCFAAGMYTLPQLLKVLTFDAGGKEISDEIFQKEMFVECLTIMQHRFCVHSVFVCPIIIVMATAENPPVRLTCGHVLTKFNISSLIASVSANDGHINKCPHCNTVTDLNKVIELKF